MLECLECWPACRGDDDDCRPQSIRLTMASIVGEFRCDAFNYERENLRIRVVLGLMIACCCKRLDDGVVIIHR